MMFRGYMLPAQIRNHFVTLPGSQEIASEFALHAIWDLYRDLDPESVCEVGHGVGTITFMLAMWRTSRTQIIAVEDNPWCIEQARRNLGLASSYLQMDGAVLWYDKIPSYEIFDMIVVDGPQVSAQDWESCLADRAVVVFEGNRREQRALFEATMRRCGRRFCRINIKPLDRSKGVWVYQTQPDWRERYRYFKTWLVEWCRDVRARWRGQPIGKRRPR